MDSRFTGVVPAIITPLTSEGKLNEDAFRQVMEFNIEAGVQGFWVAGGTGESVLLDDAENMRIAEIAADQAAGRAYNIMHVGVASTHRAARLAEHAAKAGCEAICCVPPYFYMQSDKAVAEHYRVVAEAADLPFFAYNVPGFTHREIDIPLMRRIQDEVPQLTGLKHSGANTSLVKDFADMGLSCYIGNSTLMLPALTLGASGCVDGPPNVAPECWVAIWNSWQAGDLSAARAAQEAATKVTMLVRSCGSRFHAVCKAILSRRLGVACGDPRPPGEPLTDDEVAAIHGAMSSLGLD
ncbi:MAG: dihydrodipicolinate synthase family protein [Caldilineaceae bacterium SB0664_bin_22]|nr:dihydrodipicolinate synthase family protein [Caldilineaceae bacterium SB0664_bin_22]